MKVKIDQIEIPERFRKEYGDVKGLADSIKRLGLINPITISLCKKVPTLTAGGRRLQACKSLGMEDIECRVYEELDTLERREIEVEENIKRKELTWQEEVQAKEELAILRARAVERGTRRTEFSVVTLADELDMSQGGLSQDIQLSQALREFPELALEENKSRAFKKYQQKKEAIVRAVLASALNSESESFKLYEGDCLEVLDRLEKESINLIITDPPWGVEVEKNAFIGENPLTFEDSEKPTFELLEKVVPLLWSILKDGSHMYFFFGTKQYTRIYEMLSAYFAVDPIPLNWKRPHGGPNTFPLLKFNPDYETFFFCKKGRRNLTRARETTFIYDRPSLGIKLHPQEKPLGLIEELVTLSSYPNEIILDPFAGSGVVGEAGVKAGRKVILIEKEKEWADKIRIRIGRV